MQEFRRDNSNSSIGPGDPQNSIQRDHGWRRVKVIYFGLASVDVVVILLSIAFAYFLLAAFQKGTGRNMEFDQQSASLTGLSSAISEAQLLVTNSFVERQAKIPAADLRMKSANFTREFGQFKRQIENISNLPFSKRIGATLTKIETGYAQMERYAANTLAAIGRGDDAQARQEFMRMQARYATLQFLVRDVSQKVNLQRKAASERDVKTIEEIQNYQIAIATLLAVVIAGIVIYGLFAGRLVRAKFQEVALANSELARSNAEVMARSEEMERINGEVAALNRQLEENLVKLRDAQDELLRKGRLSQLGQLTATVAHELRNPLGAVRTSAFLLARKVKDKVLGVDDQIARINNGISRCDGIITQLLDFARTKALQTEHSNLDDWVARVVEEESQSLPPSVAVECHLGTGGARIKFDSGQMNRVLINLMSNASEAMVGRGDDAMKAHSRQPRIIISTAFTSRGVEIAVADNGPGIPESIASKILEPLFTTKSFGTGLGLPAVVKIMEQHGGGIDVESRAGSGACFIAWWPAGADEREVA